jgi:hypothetical protein
MAEVIGFFKGTGSTTEIEMAKLSKHLEKGYYAIQDLGEFKTLSKGILDALPKVVQERGAVRG